MIIFKFRIQKYFIYLLFIVISFGVCWFIVNHKNIDFGSEYANLAVGLNRVSASSITSDFTLKDSGGIGGAIKVEGEAGWMYHVVGQNLATYNINYTPPQLKSFFSLPSKTANIKLWGDYVFLVGNYGLRIYRKSDLKNGTAGVTPPLVASYSSGVGFMDVSIQSYGGVPISGVLVAAIEPVNNKDAYFFRWDASNETLGLLRVYDDPVLNSKSSIMVCSLDPLRPKFYLASAYGANANSIHEYDISNLNSIIALAPFNLNTFKVPSDMAIYQDELWLANWGVDNSFPQRNFRVFKTASDHGLTEYGYIDTCTKDPQGIGHPSCQADSECRSTLFTAPMGHACQGDHCRCIEGTCQDCVSGAVHAQLDIVEDSGLVAATTGMSEDGEWIHNIYLMSSANAATTHRPLATGKSIDWSYDVAGIPGKILVSDEWTNALILNYSGSGSNYSIIPHASPNWLEPTRIFGAGYIWPHYQAWINNGRVYGGENMTSLDLNNLKNYNSWYNFQSDIRNQWWVINGQHRGSYIFAKGTKENFLVTSVGINLFLLYENPATRRMSLLNNPDSSWYQGDSNALMARYGNPVEGNVLWLNDYVALTSLGNHGLHVFYLNPSLSGAINLKAKTEAGKYYSSPSVKAETFQSVEQVKNNTIAVGKSWISIGGASPDNDWGGVNFYNISYSTDGLPPTPSNPGREISITASNPSKLNCLLRHGVYKIDKKVIGDNVWLIVNYHDGDITAFNSNYDQIAVFKYNNINQYNAICKAPNETGYSASVCQNQLASMTIPNSLFQPTPSTNGTPKHAIFWKDNLVAVAVTKQDGDFDSAVGVWVFEISEKADGTFNFYQKYFYPGYVSPHVTFVPRQYSGYSDVSTYLLPSPIHLVANGDDLLVFNQSGGWARLGSIYSQCSDQDGDGFGANCSAGSDCNDNNPLVYPGAEDVCSDAIDQNCSGADLTCFNCSEGAILTKCVCGSSLRESGYCCNNSYQVNACSDITPPSSPVGVTVI